MIAMDLNFWYGEGTKSRCGMQCNFGGTWGTSSNAISDVRQVTLSSRHPF